MSTRLEDFADRVVVAILDSGDCHCGESHKEMVVILEREVRAFVFDLLYTCDGVEEYSRKDVETWLDSPAERSK